MTRIDWLLAYCDLMKLEKLTLLYVSNGCSSSLLDDDQEAITKVLNSRLIKRKIFFISQTLFNV